MRREAQVIHSREKNTLIEIAAQSNVKVRRVKKGETTLSRVSQKSATVANRGRKTITLREYVT